MIQKLERAEFANPVWDGWVCGAPPHVGCIASLAVRRAISSTSSILFQILNFTTLAAVDSRQVSVSLDLGTGPWEN
jgi:hypothetical protein